MLLQGVLARQITMGICYSGFCFLSVFLTSVVVVVIFILSILIVQIGRLIRILVITKTPKNAIKNPELAKKKPRKRDKNPELQDKNSVVYTIRRKRSQEDAI